jgi:hypothetical protein
MMKTAVLDGEKTNPNKANLFSPQHCWGFDNQFEKTKHVLSAVEWANFQ